MHPNAKTGSQVANRTPANTDIYSALVKFNVLGPVEYFQEGAKVAVGGPNSVPCWRCSFAMPATWLPSIR